MPTKALPYKEVIILSHKWKVKEVPNGHKELNQIEIDPSILEPLSAGGDLEELGLSVIECYGTIDEGRHIIFINADAPYSEKLETLIHEIAHIIVMGFDKFDMASEDYLRIFIAVMFDTMVRNKIKFW